ncbi:MAG TPA: amidase [Acidobacteriaceae bacterium]|nr:amidase [Acidobacteriaceae bacterium]
MRFTPLAETMDSLAAGETTSRKLVETCLAAAIDPSGQGARTFTRIDADSALHAADTIDKQRRAGAPQGLLSGLPISLKDLFDIAGEPTPAGSIVLADAPPALKDAAAVARLRDAGAVLVGRTNMSEFAYSGLGINPHYGTPRNPYDRINGHIPGGSSSGAAISVTDGMAAAAIGTDTGGSLRIPAALCGLTTFKPTARRVSREGVLPLSKSFDSVGPIAPTVACCSRIDAVLSGDPQVPLLPSDVKQFRLGILQGYVLDGLDTDVARRFEAAISTLSGAGANLKEVQFSALDGIPGCYVNGGIQAFEAYEWHRQLIAKHSELYDPRVLVRILRGKEISQAQHLELVNARRRIISEAGRAFADVDVWLLPTVPRIAPLIADVVSNDAAYFEANAAMLRNTSIVNFLDGCALSIPCHLPGEAPVGLMLAAPGDRDHELFRIGAAIEAALARAGCAIALSPLP